MKNLIYLLLVFTLLAEGCKHKSRKPANTEQKTLKVLVASPQRRDIVYTYQYPAYLEASANSKPRCKSIWIYRKNGLYTRSTGEKRPNYCL